MTNLDMCEYALRTHVPFENPARPLHHGVHATCHRCKASIWWDTDAANGYWSGKWRSHKIVEWP